MNKPWAVFLSAGFLGLSICDDAPSQRIPELKSGKPASQRQSPLPIATGKHRISRDKQTIAIFRGSQKVTVDYFIELVIVRMTDINTDPEKLNGEAISLSRTKQRDQWDVFRGGASGGATLILAGNVFRIQKVLSSTPKDQVKVQIDGRVYRLEPGEVLLLLG